MGARKHYAYMDYLNVLGAFAVVALHCSTSVYLNTGDLRWKLDVVVQALFIFAVPVFFMISGANLLGYRRRSTTGTFLLRRVRRVVTSLILYSLLYYAVKCIHVNGILFASRAFSIGDFLKLFLTNQINDVFWFFYAIILIYLLTPLLSLASERPSLLRYCLLVSGVVGFAVPLINRLFDVDLYFVDFNVQQLFGYVFYYLIGYYLVHVWRPVGHVEHRGKRILLLSLCLIACVAAGAALTYMLNAGNQIPGAGVEYNNYALSYTGPVVLVQSVVVFLLAQSIRETGSKTSRLDRLARSLSPLCLGVYGLHMLVFSIFNVVAPHNIKWDLGIRPVAVFLASLVCAFVWASIGKGVGVFARRVKIQMRNRIRIGEDDGTHSS